MLNQYDVDGAIYLVPGPIMIRTMAYNKTLFEERGWKAPTTHGELVELVKQIRAESDLTPISFGAKGLGYYFTTMTTLAQTAYLAKAQGTAWEKAYLAGDISCREGFQPGIDMLQELIDADAYDIELDIDHWDAGAMERLIRREAAMITIWGLQTEFIDKMAQSADELLLLPFYNEDGEPFLGTNVSIHMGLAKRLNSSGNEKKLENALQVMEWFSTPEGMSALNTGTADIMPLTAANNLNTAEAYRKVWESNLSGMKAPMLYAGYEDILIQSSEFIKDAMINRKSLNGLVDLIDQWHQEALNTPKATSFGSIAERFSHEETVQLMANILQSANLADISMVSAGGCLNGVSNFEGVNGKLYEGELYISDLPTCLPGAGLNAEVQVLTLSGRQIKSLLENGKRLCSAGNTEGKPIMSAAFDYYWAGMDVTMEAGTVTSMALSGGMNMAMDGMYTVAFAADDCPDELELSGNPAETEVGCQDLYKAYLAANSPLSPPELLRK